MSVDVVPEIRFAIGVGNAPYDIDIDQEKYATYLGDMGASPDQVAELKVCFRTDPRLPGLGAVYSPDDNEIEVYCDGKSTGEELSSALRHESSHFIDFQVLGKTRIQQNMLFAGQIASMGAFAKTAMETILTSDLPGKLSKAGIAIGFAALTEGLVYTSAKFTHTERKAYKHQDDPEVIRRYGNFVTCTPNGKRNLIHVPSMEDMMIEDVKKYLELSKISLSMLNPFGD